MYTTGDNMENNIQGGRAIDEVITGFKKGSHTKQNLPLLQVRQIESAELVRIIPLGKHFFVF